MITIIDYGMGNLGSLLNMFKRIRVPALITSNIDDIESAEKLILPGVGAFDTAINNINNIKNLRRVLDYKALSQKVPILGICLGMQLLTNSSEESKCKHSGLGWIPGVTKRFPNLEGLKIPHMGWNKAYANNNSDLTKDLSSQSRYYFVHSYHVKVDEPKYSIMTSRYGINFDSAICKDNIYGTQFHPEKSHSFGMQILMNFSKI